MRTMNQRTGRRAVTLVEVIVATAILAVAAAYSISAMIVAARMARTSQQELIAIEVLNRVVEQVRAAPLYNFLGDPTVAGTAPVGPGNSEDITFTHPRTIVYDADIAQNAITFTATFEWWGFGPVANASGTTLEFSTAGWPRNADGDVEIDPVGRRVVIREGSGRGQMAEITGFTETGTDTGRFTVTNAFNGWTDANWMVTPNTTSFYEVDAGRNVRVTVTWPNGDPMIRDVFVPFRP
jgi:prepilin-type N-terminal cleavage/methylation domain-containing protein